MDRANAARVQEWDARPVSGGHRGLRELADAGFSGVVTTGTAWLFLLNGRIVGVSDGTLESFDSGDLTAYEAPDPTLPLLFSMQEQGGETRAKYYTDDNPLPEVHETLSDANFTGYIELSDNVLSGDYYVVYYGGRSMSAAFVGSGGQLVTGDEAFHRAADEVGIYEVINVDLEVRDVPTQKGDQDGRDESSVTTDASIGGVNDPDESDGIETVADVDESDPTPDPAGEEPPASEGGAPVEGGPIEEEPTDPSPEPAAATAPDPEPVDAGADEPAPSGDVTQSDSAEEAPDPGTQSDDPFSQEAAWRETRTIPALDPEETEAPTPAEDGGRQPEAQPQPVAEPPTKESTDATATPEPAVDADRLAELEAAIERQSETISALESKLESTNAEAQQLRAEREELQSELEDARSNASAMASGNAEPNATSMDPAAALDQTDLFVRYGTKGGGTLEKAHDGTIDREEVVENLRIDHHTRFEEDEVTVEGEPFETFLGESLEYRFVNWLVYELLFEIQDTGSQRGLRELFDVLPLIDRVEFAGVVSWSDQDGDETHEQEFDVVCRDRMGQALVVANLNDVRDPASGDMMAGLIDGASTVAEGVETLGGAFMVTSSFFQPDALETASDATGGGLLSRDKRWSYVKLGRKQGYHLCLVEARGDEFHVAVPEL